MKTLIVLLLAFTFVYGQKYQVEKVTGEVKVLTDTKGTWTDVREGMQLSGSSVLKTGNGGSVTVLNDGVRFTLRPVAALAVSTIKHLTIDELLLVLAMEEVLNAPKKGNNGEVKNLAVYGTPAASNESVSASGLGQLRINGAIQLAENGFEESAIATAKEVMRKYPETKQNSKNRLYFADLMYKLSLANEAYTEYADISKLNLTEPEKETVKVRMNELKKRLTAGKK